MKTWEGKSRFGYRLGYSTLLSDRSKMNIVTAVSRETRSNGICKSISLHVYTSALYARSVCSHKQAKDPV